MDLEDSDDDRSIAADPEETEIRAAFADYATVPDNDDHQNNGYNGYIVKEELRQALIQVLNENISVSLISEALSNLGLQQLTGLELNEFRLLYKR